jgi:hypothetical protein
MGLSAVPMLISGREGSRLMLYPDKESVSKRGTVTVVQKLTLQEVVGHCDPLV